VPQQLGLTIARRSGCVVGQLEYKTYSYGGGDDAHDIVLILILVGLVLWLVNTYIPMAAGIKSLLNIVVFPVVLIWLLQPFGLIGSVPIRIRPLK
jgi:hypothetical protein